MGGLSAALALSARGLPVRVLEAADRPGGKAGWVEVDGVRVETGPNGIGVPFQKLTQGGDSASPQAIISVRGQVELVQRHIILFRRDQSLPCKLGAFFRERLCQLTET